jgi:XRE family aerobic/anaerobic benzoate catabolism transcriptional regulator
MARDICIAVGRRIRELRKARNWRQLDLAEHARLNENYISDLEIGKKEVCIRTLHAIAKAFGMSLGEFTKDL